MMALCPEAVDMESFGDNTGWYTKTAKDASAELGGKGRDLFFRFAVNRMAERKSLKKPRPLPISPPRLSCL